MFVFADLLMSIASGRKLAEELEELNDEITKVSEEIRSLQKRKHELVEKRKHVKFSSTFHI